ncbi:LysR family transcriptional regulator [Brachybacterium sp. sponge]|uniref:LysR family transcriptional regulator n=1 Tax=Brachybacterium sp. sponge TaxID=1775432 RepID=UPI0007A4A7B5|nr:LysR family transcriptional regulator [Brachybacterium sp. sponge]
MVQADREPRRNATDGAPPLSHIVPSLAQLEALIAVTDHGTHTAAADVLRISQPSLSRRIHSLEKALGTRLLVPVGRRTELTDAGRGVVAAGRRALAEMGSIEALVGSARALTSGSLRVGGLPSLVATELPAHLGRFHRAHPGVRLEVSTVEDADALVEAVRVGRVDAAVGVIDRVPEDLAAIPLPAQEFAAVLAEDSRADGDDEPLTGEDVAARSFVTLPRGTSMRQLADAALQSLDARPAQRITTTQRDSLVPLAVAVDGLTIVPAALARTAPAFGGRVVPLREAVQRSIGIVHRPDELPNPALAGFLALVRAADVGAGDV